MHCVPAVRTDPIKGYPAKSRIGTTFRTNKFASLGFSACCSDVLIEATNLLLDLYLNASG